MLKPLIERLFRDKLPYRLDTLINNEVTLFANSPLYWGDRAAALDKLVSFAPQNSQQAARKHKDLQIVLDHLKAERKSYQPTLNKLADAELVKLSLLTVRSIKSLRETYPDIQSESRPQQSIDIRSAFRSAATKTTEWAETVRTNPHVQKTAAMAGLALKAAGLRIANDARELSAPLRQNISDAVQDAKIVLKEKLDTIPLIRNIDWSNPQHRRLTTNAASYVAIFGLAAGVASHITSHEIEKSAEQETKPISFKFEEPRLAKPDDDVFSRPVINNTQKKKTSPIYVAKAEKARKTAPIYVASSKSFSEDEFYSFDDESLDTKRKELKGHKLSKWNWDALLKPKYRELVVGATHKLLQMSPTDVFKGLLMTESGGHQFDKNGNVVTSSKGATGAAQVMPETARLIAQRCTGDNLDWSRFRNDREYNVKMGKCYFNEQHETFGNNNVAALLAYNGGPGSDTMRAGLKHNLRKAGISLSHDGETMVELIKSIRNTENRHYTLITMTKLGLIDPKELGEDVTNGYTGTYRGTGRSRSRIDSDSTNSETPVYRWQTSPESQEKGNAPDLRHEFQRSGQMLKGRELQSRELSSSTPSLRDEDTTNPFYQEQPAILAKSEKIGERAATLD